MISCPSRNLCSALPPPPPPPPSRPALHVVGFPMENKRQPSPEIADLMNRVQVELDRTDRLFTRRINEILVRLRVDDTTLVRMFPVPHHGREPECKCCRLPLAERTAISCMVDAVCPKKE